MSEQNPARSSRREFWGVAAAGLATGCNRVNHSALAVKGGESVVAIVKAATYSDDLTGRILEGIKECGLDVKGKKVLLKPNLVEFDRNTAINTDVAVVAAAWEAFRSLGAEVVIGEGPGHRRDAFGIAEEAGYRSGMSKFEANFVDLNRDDVTRVEKFADHKEIYLPNSALGADLVVSLAKMKTHHWAGATLSMKNFFGLVPGAVYGWPKNFLHMTGIPTSIIELNRIFRKTFAIVDGIVGMEGNGPIQGTPKNAGVLVMGSDNVAVDATCCRIMGIDPFKVEYIAGAQHLGIVDGSRIGQRGESINSVQTDFKLIKEFAYLRT